jgi:hypothetical protein
MSKVRSMGCQPRCDWALTISPLRYWVCPEADNGDRLCSLMTLFFKTDVKW